jgi:predicted RNase H-like HicB family nuclease
MAKDAVTAYIESLRKHREPIPTDNETLVTTVDLEYARAASR